MTAVDEAAADLLATLDPPVCETDPCADPGEVAVAVARALCGCVRLVGPACVERYRRQVDPAGTRVCSILCYSCRKRVVARACDYLTFEPL